MADGGNLSGARSVFIRSEIHFWKHFNSCLSLQNFINTLPLDLQSIGLNILRTGRVQTIQQSGGAQIKLREEEYARDTGLKLKRTPYDGSAAIGSKYEKLLQLVLGS